MDPQDPQGGPITYGQALAEATAVPVPYAVGGVGAPRDNTGATLAPPGPRTALIAAVEQAASQSSPVESLISSINPTTAQPPGLPDSGVGVTPTSRALFLPEEYGIGTSGAKQEPEELKNKIDALTTANEQLVKAMAVMENNAKEMRDLMNALISAQAESAQPSPPARAPLIPPLAGASKAGAVDDDVEQDIDDDLQEIHIKDVGKPTKYNGVTMNWRGWITKFRRFLVRRDRRWGLLLDAIRERSVDPLTPAIETEIFQSLAISKQAGVKFQEQLYDYLEEYTEGLVHSNLVNSGHMGAMENFRQLCEEGFSYRDRNLRREYKKIIHPKQSTFDNLRRDIAAWESELAQYQLASGTEMSLKDKLMCLEDLCPEELQKHLDTKATDVKTYNDMKNEINTCLVNRKRWGHPARAALKWVTEAEEEQQEEPQAAEGPELAAEDQTLLEQCGHLMALVQNKFGKKGTGKGAGKKGQQQGKQDGDVAMGDARPPRACYDCGSQDHLAKDCPVRAARVAAGGPERLDGSKGGKGGKGGKNGKGGKGGKGTQWPTKQWWNQQYPGPSPTQWKQWYPPAPGKGGASLFQSPFQLSAISSGQDNDGQAASFMQQLFQRPGGIFSIVQKGPKATPVTEEVSVKTQNKFEALTEDGATAAPSSTLTVELEDAIKPASRNRQRKQKAKLCKPHDHHAHGCCDLENKVNLNGCSGRGGCSTSSILDFVKSSFTDLSDKAKLESKDGPRSLRVLTEVMKSSLRPLTTATSTGANPKGMLEVMSAIVDSGASVPVFHPSTAQAYELMESEASKRGVEYEIANGDILKCLGEKRIAVCTAEGTVRGYGSQCADVSKPLQAVRSLVKSKHAVCFGLGDGDDHLIINKESGEVNRMRDDGVNYYQDLLIIPPDKIDQFCAELNAVQTGQHGGQANEWQNNGNAQPFGWPAP